MPTRYCTGGSLLAHLGENRLGRDAAIHHPDASGLAVLRLDLAEEAAQRRLVGGVAGQHFVGKRQAVRRHHQGDHHLRTVRPLVAAIAVAALVAFGHIGGIDLEIGAGQVVEQNVEAGVEQVAPAVDEMAEQRLLVGEQVVVAGDRACAPRRERSRRPADRPWRSCRTTRDAASTRCRVRSAGRQTRTCSTGPSVCPCGCRQIVGEEAIEFAARATAARPASRRPTAAAGEAAVCDKRSRDAPTSSPASQRSSGNSARVCAPCPSSSSMNLDGPAPGVTPARR